MLQMRTTLCLLTAALLSSCYNPDIANRGYTCLPPPEDDPNRHVCPESFSCVNGLCEKSTGTGSMALAITKSGAPYTGNHVDPMLGDANACPDAALEPNDSPS